MDFSAEFFKAGVKSYIIREYDRQGKIPAIKAARDILGLGLKEAKEYTEAICENKSVKLTVIVPRRVAMDLRRNELAGLVTWMEDAEEE